MVKSHFKTTVNCDCAECVMRPFDLGSFQSRAAEINRRMAADKVKSDRQFYAIIAFIWFVAIVAVVGFYSLPRADRHFKSQDLDIQEIIRHG